MHQGLAALYGWAPDIIGRMTAAQIMAFSQPLDGEDNTVTFNTAREAMAYIARVKGGA